MMHSVLITNPEGKILLSRYFETQNDGPDYAYADYDADAAGDAAGSDITLRKGGEGGSIMRDRAMAMCSSESEVLGQTRHLWTKGTAECPQVARAKGGLIIVFGAVEGLLMFLCGSGEYDELTLAEILSTLAKVITALCRQGNKSQQVTQEALMSSSTYSKACLAIDEMLPGGIPETLDADCILGAIKLQNPVTASKQG
eukprot:jgi/Undpi1/12772/HiC_scaffold_6.g02440.m1